MKALVLGLGLSGKSATQLLEKRGYEVVGVDDKVNPRVVERIEDFSLFVPSPGISQSHPLYVRALKAKILIKGEIQLFLETIKSPCVAVTGTNGKTTVVKMIEHCLNLCGKKARAVGNVGVPMTCGEGSEILIVELSSFQLETLSERAIDVGLILNIAEDHLDRYESFDQYAKTKASLENCMKADGVLYVHKSVDQNFFSKACKLYEGGNIEVAQLVCAQFGICKDEFSKALASFLKPEHRLEFVAKIDGIPYYNDSKATNVAAVLSALNEIPQKVVLIVGGRDKGLSFEPLQKVRKRFSSVIIYGEAREKIANALQHLSNVYQVETLEEAVKKSNELALPTDAVVFSPGCSSYDAFENYEERGKAFKEFVLRSPQ